MILQLLQMDSLHSYLDELVKRGYTNSAILAFLEKDLDLCIRYKKCYNLHSSLIIIS